MEQKMILHMTWMQEWIAAQALQVPPRSPQYLLSKSMKLQLSLEKKSKHLDNQINFYNLLKFSKLLLPGLCKYILKWCKSIFSMTWRISISNDYKTWSNCLNNLSFPRKSWDFVVQKYATGGGARGHLGKLNFIWKNFHFAFDLDSTLNYHTWHNIIHWFSNRTRKITETTQWIF